MCNHTKPSAGIVPWRTPFPKSLEEITGKALRHEIETSYLTDGPYYWPILYVLTPCENIIKLLCPGNWNVKAAIWQCELASKAKRVSAEGHYSERGPQEVFLPTIVWAEFEPPEGSVLDAFLVRLC